jgi:hypothetical protein
MLSMNAPLVERTYTGLSGGRGAVPWSSFAAPYCPSFCAAMPKRGPVHVLPTIDRKKCCTVTCCARNAWGAVRSTASFLAAVVGRLVSIVVEILWAMVCIAGLFAAFFAIVHVLVPNPPLLGLTELLTAIPEVDYGCYNRTHGKCWTTRAGGAGWCDAGVGTKIAHCWSIDGCSYGMLCAPGGARGDFTAWRLTADKMLRPLVIKLYALSKYYTR